MSIFKFDYIYKIKLKSN